MDLHNNKDVFEELVTATACQLGLPEVYIEKDYWVTKMLLNLAHSNFSSQLVFKGGTALSKAHKLIRRFSEDVDLALIPEEGFSSNQLRSFMRNADGFTIIDNHAKESKGSRFRKTVYQYPVTVSGEFGQASPELLLEINTFTKPEPATVMSMQSLIAEYLVSIGRVDLTSKYGLESFELLVLNIERTLCEKVMGLVKAFRLDDTLGELKSKIRHVYDVALILREPKYQSYLASDAFLELLSTVKETDLKQPRSSEWLEVPLDQVGLFSESDIVWPRVENEFNGPFADMVYDDLPDSDEVLGMLKTVQERLIQFEREMVDVKVD